MDDVSEPSRMHRFLFVHLTRLAHTTLEIASYVPFLIIGHIEVENQTNRKHVHENNLKIGLILRWTHRDGVSEPSRMHRFLFVHLTRLAHTTPEIASYVPFLIPPKTIYITIIKLIKHKLYVHIKTVHLFI